MCYCSWRSFCLAFILLASSPSLMAASQCHKQPVIFNFGDSNSDTGGFAAANGFNFGFPYARAFFHQPTGRLSDGRLIIDFLCESLNTRYLKAYLNPLQPNISNGVNFAVSGSSTLPRNALFNLGVQINQFSFFRNRSIQLHSKGEKDLLGKKDFKNALYIFDIGQNDVTVAFFNSLPHDQLIESIPSFISEIERAMRVIHGMGGRKFWVHNTGPLGCLPQQLGIRKPNASEVDEYGCITILNQSAREFNSKLKDAVEKLRLEMEDSTIVYVDVYSIKHSLIANSTYYGFKKPLMACCGDGGPPYNYNPKIRCLVVAGFSVCKKGSLHISWDGIHLKYSPPNTQPLLLDSTSFAINYYCNTLINYHLTSCILAHFFTTPTFTVFVLVDENRFNINSNFFNFVIFGSFT